MYGILGTRAVWKLEDEPGGKNGLSAVAVTLLAGRSKLEVRRTSGSGRGMEVE